jgi:hypothetical protein
MYKYANKAPVRRPKIEKIMLKTVNIAVELSSLD